MQKQRKIVVLLLVSMLLLGGCGRAEGQQQNQNSEEKNQSKTTEQNLNVEEERPTITIAMPQKGTVIDYDTNYLTLLLEEKANVNIEFEMFPADESEMFQKIALMVTAGTELPDIITYLDADYSKYGESGVILPLNEYLNNPEVMPNFYEDVPEEDRKYMLAGVAQADGAIYGFPGYATDAASENPYKAWINTTWLDKLGLSMPETTEDLYKVLKAFKEQDPNDNGKQDEIPMIGATKGTGSTPFPFLLNAFVYADAYYSENAWLSVEGGKIVSAFTKDEWREGLEYINKLVSEGLLSPLSFTQDYNQLRAILNSSEGQMVGCFTRLAMSTYDSGNPNRTDMDVLAPITGPDGTCFATSVPAKPDAMFFITKDCENVDAAVRLIDLFYDAEISMITRYGEPEVDWSANVEGISNPFEEDSEFKVGFTVINEIWGKEQNKHWTGANIAYRSKYIVQGNDADADPYSGPVMSIKALPFYQDKHPEELISVLTFTAEEQTEVADLRAAIRQYVDESMVRFATGELSFDKWDDYIETLNDMGLERYLELTQNAYDRFKSN